MNPYESIQIKHFEIFGLTNWIHEMNLLKTGLQIKSTIWVVWKQIGFVNHNLKQTQWLGFTNPDLCFIFKELYIVLRILEDLWGYVRFIKTGWFFRALAGFVILNSKPVGISCSKFICSKKSRMSRFFHFWEKYIFIVDIITI